MKLTIIAPDLEDTAPEPSTPRKPLPFRGETRFPGITRHADELGVSRPHLFLVLTGQRQSSVLLQRYRALLKQEGRPCPPLAA